MRFLSSKNNNLSIIFQLAVANPRWKVIHKLKVAKFLDKIGQGWIFLTVSEAVDARFGSKMAGPCISV